jgi:hypothetical protein
MAEPPSPTLARRAESHNLIQRIGCHAALWTLALAHGGFGLYLIAR